MLIKQDVGINPYVANNGSRDQSLTGIGGPWVYVLNGPFNKNCDQIYGGGGGWPITF